MSNYDRWKSGYDDLGYDDRLDEFLGNNYVHKDKLPDLKEVKSALNDIMSIIYGYHDINNDKLDQLCTYVSEEMDLDIYPVVPSIERVRLDLEFLKAVK